MKQAIRKIINNIIKAGLINSARLKYKKILMIKIQTPSNSRKWSNLRQTGTLLFKNQEKHKFNAKKKKL